MVHARKLSRANTVARLLIVGPSWVGDMVMAQTLFKLLRQKSPDTDIDVLAPAASLALVARMPEVSMGILVKAGHGELRLSYRKGLGEQLRERGYTQAIVLPNSLKSALIPLFAGIPVRTGYQGEYRYWLVNDMRMLNRVRQPRMVDQFMALGLPIGRDLPPLQPPALIVDEANRAALLPKLGLSLDRPVLCLCPGAEYGDAKKWPARHFATLASHAIGRGMQVWIMGGPADCPDGAAIMGGLDRDQVRHCFDLTGKTTLLDAVDLLSHGNLVVSNDSGLMHIAAATGRKLAVVYGSTSPAFTPPLCDSAEILSENLACSPCFARSCPLQHKNCLNQLLPERLYALVDASLPAQPQ
jgi:heptosyltransferase II